MLISCNTIVDRRDLFFYFEVRGFPVPSDAYFFFNDIVNDIGSSIRPFADDTSIYIIVEDQNATIWPLTSVNLGNK